MFTITYLKKFFGHENMGQILHFGRGIVRPNSRISVDRFFLLKNGIFHKGIPNTKKIEMARGNILTYFEDFQKRKIDFWA